MVCCIRVAGMYLEKKMKDINQRTFRSHVQSFWWQSRRSDGSDFYLTFLADMLFILFLSGMCFLFSLINIHISTKVYNLEPKASLEQLCFRRTKLKANKCVDIVLCRCRICVV